MVNKYGILRRTTYRSPGAALTARGMAHELRRFTMHSHDTPSKSESTIQAPRKLSMDIHIPEGYRRFAIESVPQFFVEKWNFDPADSFRALPVGYNLADHRVPDPAGKTVVAPFIPLYDDDDDRWYWECIRCPYCGSQFDAKHASPIPRNRHDPTWPANGWMIDGNDCGPGWGEYCPKYTKWNSTDNSYHFWGIGVNREPAQRELDKYFPLVEIDTTVPPSQIRRKIQESPKDEGSEEIGGVYLIKAADRYKIGISTDPAKRITSIATSSPYPVEVVHIETTTGYKSLERYVHRQLADFRVHLEWFEFPDDLIPAVIDLIKGGAK